MCVPIPWYDDYNVLGHWGLNTPDPAATMPQWEYPLLLLVPPRRLVGGFHGLWPYLVDWFFYPFLVVSNPLVCLALYIILFLQGVYFSHAFA